MICSKCGNELPQNTNICSNCGTVHQISPFEQPVIQQPTMQQPTMQQPQNVLSGTDIWGEQYDEPQYVDEYSKVFVESDENLLATLGNGYMINMLYKNVKKCHALLTDKRVYLQGSFFEGSGTKLTKIRSEKIVEVDDITGTGFTYVKGFGILISIIILLVGAGLGWCLGGEYWVRGTFSTIGFFVALIVDIICYFLSRKAFFIIEYAGGSISFNASIVGIADVRDFQKQIHRAKNKAKGK